ncbi:TIGR03086 family metal-binding protein [Spirillospora sp. CA-294931]|uniref:TIGR03086 family metal-binding protein n=1 Tax=Spirillospora sp. CA-294931 TaxID=3240042 RepID=UPI003D94510C
MSLLDELLTADFRELDRRAADLYLEAVAHVTPEQLRLPTPCADWTVHGLLRHQVSQDEGFAAAARGEGETLSVWRNGLLGDDPYGAAKRSLALVTEAFGEDGVLEREFVLPEVRQGGGFPARLAISFHFVDLVVHAWDVAAAVGAAWEPDAALVEAALKVAAIVPSDPETRGPGLSFDQVSPVPAGAPGKDELLGALGRDPGWRP